MRFLRPSLEDIIGSVPIAVAAENTGQGSCIVVIGNSTFAIDSNYAAYGNGDFLINSIDCAAKQDIFRLI